MTEPTYNPEKKHTPKQEPLQPAKPPQPPRAPRQAYPNGVRPRNPAPQVPNARAAMQQMPNVGIKAGVRQVTQVPYAQVLVGNAYANIPVGDALMFASTTFQVATMAYVDAVLLSWFQTQMGYSQAEAWQQLELFQQFRQQFAATQEEMQRAAGAVPTEGASDSDGE